MEYIGNDNFAHNFFSGSNSHIFDYSKYFSLNITQPQLKWNLTASVISIFLILLFIKNTLSKRKSKLGLVSYVEGLPYHQWIPFVKWPLVDGIIFWYKRRKDGVKVAESIVNKDRPSCRFSYGFKTVVGVSDPNIVQKLLSSTNPGHLNKPQALYARAFSSILKDGLLASDVNTWSSHRKVLSLAFKYKSHPTYLKIICNEAKELIQSACYAATEKGNGTICGQKISALIDHHTVKITTHIILGSESFHISEKEIIFFHEKFKRMKELTVGRFQRPELMIPIIWWLHPKRKEMEKTTKNLVEFVCQFSNKIKMKRMVNKGEGNADDTLIQEKISQSNTNKLVEQKEKDYLGIKSAECIVELMIKAGFTNKEISDEIATFLAAGHETVKVATDMLIFHVAKNLEHQDKCRAEIDMLFSTKGDDKERDFNLDDFANLKYLEMCIQESMRLTPTVPVFYRELLEPLKIKDDSVIPAGEMITVLVWALHRNPEIYPNPEKYDPGRFLPENVKQRHPYSFIPFSMGMRNCIGWKIALLEIKVLMAWILRHFEIHTTDGPNDVKLLSELTLRPERPYNVTFKKRNN